MTAIASHASPYDVVVVGGGGSGLCAAIEAAALGRRVLLVEKNERLGGSTALSFGSIAASGTPHQRARGIDDDPERHGRELAAFNGELDHRDNPVLRRVLAQAIPDTFDWLVSLGVRLYGPLPDTDRTPRVHVVLPNSRAYIAHLARTARRNGVRIACGLRAQELLVDHGRVVGVACENGGTRVCFRASGGVVLATGDYTADPELKARYMGEQAATIGAINTTATGDGQKLALKLGARILNGELALGPELRFMPPPRESLLLKLPPWPLMAALMVRALRSLPRWLLRPLVMRFATVSPPLSPKLYAPGALLVNRLGERLPDVPSNPAYTLAGQPGQTAYILLDRRLAQRYSKGGDFISTAPGIAHAYVDDYRRSRPDVHAASSTLHGLARRLGMEPGVLEAGVRAFNQQQVATPGRATFGPGPYVALGPVRAVFVHSEGGLAVDESHRVLGAGDRPIAGLYAAGACGQGGLLLKGYGHHLGWAFVSGRRAGRQAAQACTTP